MREGSKSRKPIILIIGFIVIAAVVFAGAFAVGRVTKDPTTDQSYKEVASQITKTENQVKANRSTTKELTKKRNELREDLAEEKKQAEADRKVFEQYGGDTQAGKPALIVESISPDVDPLYAATGGSIDLYYYPEFTVRNNTGHVLLGAVIKYTIIGSNGNVLDGDGNAYVSNVVVYPGKTVVAEDMVKDAGFSGATIKPVGFNATIADSKNPDPTKTIDAQYADDAKTVTIP